VTAAGCAVMEALIEPGFLETVTETGQYIAERLAAISSRHGFGEVRGKGLLLALNLKQEIGKKIADAAMEKGLLLNSPRPDTLRFMPALTVTRDEIDQMFEILNPIIQEAAQTGA